MRSFLKKNNHSFEGIPMRKNLSLILLSVIISLTVTGCQQSAKKLEAKGKIINEPLINVYYIVGQLGMNMTSQSDEKLCFKDAFNTVIIYPKQDQVFLNEKLLCALGKTKNIDGLLHVRQSLADNIKNKLTIPAVEPPPAAPVVIKPVPQPEPKKAWELTGKTIVIDAGHGGKDPGATSYYGFYEKTVNLDVAIQIADLLRDKGHRVIMTRTGDVFIELEERAYIANRAKADAFISIHSDSSARSSTNGFTVYTARSGSSWAANNLAEAIDECMGKTSINSNGVKQADYRVLIHTKCPAVLVELGYLSNYWEAKQLKNVNMQKRLAQAIADGITNYLNNR